MWQVFPKAILGTLLVFSGLELTLAGARPLASEAEPALTVAYLTAGGTLVFKTGGGCAVGLFAALLSATHDLSYLKSRSRRILHYLCFDLCNFEQRALMRTRGSEDSAAVVSEDDSTALQPSANPHERLDTAAT